MRNAFLLLSLVSSIAIAGGGTDVGNATDNPTADAGAAWFTGKDRVIHYCLDVAPGFGANPRIAVEWGLATWRDYINAHHVPELLAKDSGGRALALRWEELAACDGAEDLRFAFGNDDALIRAEKAHLDHPTAFGLRASFDAVAGWGKGVVWLCPPAGVSHEKNFPDWSQEATLRLILLHELGHVFGVSHVRGTIMDAGLSGQILRGEPVQTRIDQRNQLVACWNCQEQDAPGRLGYGAAPGEDSAASVFRRFVGRDAKGPIHASLHASAAGLSLKLSDDLGARSVKLGLDPRASAVHTGFDRGERIFRLAWQNPGGFVEAADIFNGGMILYGSVPDAAKMALNLVVEVNTHSLASPGPITLRWLEGGRAHSLFFEY